VKTSVRAILIALALEEAGVRRLWVNSKNRPHPSILGKLGADRIINPESATGRQTGSSSIRLMPPRVSTSLRWRRVVPLGRRVLITRWRWVTRRPVISR